MTVGACLSRDGRLKDTVAHVILLLSIAPNTHRFLAKVLCCIEQQFSIPNVDINKLIANFPVNECRNSSTRNNNGSIECNF